MKRNLRTIKIILEYDGSQFSGWQVQPNRRTVQDEVQQALKALINEEISVTGSGRTDAGVHALGQVASFRTKSELPISVFKSGLNKYLPVDVRIIEAEEASDRFDARRNAVKRTYRYHIAKRSRVLCRQYTWHPFFEFDVDTMKQASKCLVGLHDFSSFCKKNGEIDSYTSRVLNIEWKNTDDEIRFEIAATHFYHNMVRIIVGTLLEVGRGKMTPEEFQRILEAGDRSQAGPTVPPHGLVLVKVEY